jgi:mitochondrial fission protein ELM1
VDGGIRSEVMMLHADAATDAWIVSVRRKAHVNQCVALAKAAGLTVSKTIEIAGTTATDHKFLKLIDVAKASAKCMVAFATTPVPRQKVVLCSGRSISLLIWLWKKWSGQSFLSIYVGHAKSPLVFYDMMLIPEHDVSIMNQRRRPPSTVEVFTTTGILTEQQNRSEGKNAKSVLVCLGGNNISFSYAGAAFHNFLSTLEKIQKSHDLKIAYSGRTSNETRDLIEQRADLKSTVIESHDREGFVAAQIQAASIFVCPDSVTMISEALAKGATVYVPRLEVLSQSTSDFLFVADCRVKGYILEVDDFPSPKSAARFPDSLAQAVPHVLTKIAKWKLSLG